MTKRNTEKIGSKADRIKSEHVEKKRGQDGEIKWQRTRENYRNENTEEKEKDKIEEK